MPDLFDSPNQVMTGAPLADRIRPQTLDEIVGQNHLIGPQALLRAAIEKDELRSLILWGPPGTGKTTLARVIANTTQSHFVSFSAVLSGVKEVRATVAEARDRRKYHGQKTILFVDEIHRFNKSQQDAFLPTVEDGTVILIGATTENPSFEINAALLSRSRVFVLNSLDESSLKEIVVRAVARSRENKEKMVLEEEVLDLLVQSSHGDARSCLNILELAMAAATPDADGTRTVTRDMVEQAAQKKALLYDKAGEEHYNVISALHKSIRGSDPQATVYWLYRMLDAGEDPLFVARRLVRAASEDVGLADPQALPLAIAGKDAYHFLGTPEGELALAQVALYLATAPKSNAAYVAEKRARADVDRHGPLPVPMHIRNAPTRLMKNLGYGKGYAYDHDSENSYSGQDHLPDQLTNRSYYEPRPWGFEREIRKRMDYWESKKREMDSDPGNVSDRTLS